MNEKNGIDVRQSGRCPECGGPIYEFYVQEPFLLMALGKDEPFWMASECEGCEARAEEERKKAQRSAKRQEKMNSLFMNSMLGPRYKDKTFDNYETATRKQAKILGICKRFASEFEQHHRKGTWLFFHGNCGTGKGHLCAAIIREVTRRGYSACFVKMQNLFLSIRETFRKDSEVKTSELLDQLVKVDLLVLDEVGVQLGTDFEWLTIHGIIDGRYEMMRPLILTSNEPWERVKSLLGERVMDRFHEGDNKVLPFDWESYRTRRNG
jgi:DNA replication protein DnaC